MKAEGQIRIPSGCAIAAVISKEGQRMSGDMITNAMKPMHDRSNGLGGGFAGYGIYPEYKDFYAFHMFFDSRSTRKECEAFLKERFEIVQSEIIPTRKIPAITDEPIIWRYFVSPLKSMLVSMQLDEKEFVARTVMKINTEMSGAYVFSSGKNMGTFKAVGFPEDVGVFYKLEEYEGYSWTAHGRYPTNTLGWWGGAHPFTLLDYSIVHNGEISSYDANRRFIEMFGYKCTLHSRKILGCYFYTLPVVYESLQSLPWLYAQSPLAYVYNKKMVERERNSSLPSCATYYPCASILSERLSFQIVFSCIPLHDYYYFCIIGIFTSKSLFLNSPIVLSICIQSTYPLT